MAKSTGNPHVDKAQIDIEKNPINGSGAYLLASIRSASERILCIEKLIEKESGNRLPPPTPTPEPTPASVATAPTLEPTQEPVVSNVCELA